MLLLWILNVYWRSWRRVDGASELTVSWRQVVGPNIRAQFYIELLSTTVCLAWHFFLDKNRITNQIFFCCILLVTGIQLLFAYPKNHIEIWLVILFLSRRKFHAKQICVLGSSMKLGPDLWHNSQASKCDVRCSGNNLILTLAYEMY